MDNILNKLDPQSNLYSQERRKVLKAIANVSGNQQKSEVNFVEKILQEQFGEIARYKRVIVF